MSMITEALKKAEATSETSGAPVDLPPSPSSPPLWIYRAALVGCVAVVLLGIAHFTHRPEIRAAVPAQIAKVAASPPVQRLLKLAQANMVLNGIIQGQDGRSLALIDHEVVQEGDPIRGMRVVRINPRSVEIQDGAGKTKTLQLED